MSPLPVNCFMLAYLRMYSFRHISKRIREDWSRVEAQTEIEHYLSSMLDFLPSHFSSKQVHACMWWSKT